jgi:hypothetical protein
MLFLLSILVSMLNEIGKIQEKNSSIFYNPLTMGWRRMLVSLAPLSPVVERQKGENS